MMNASLSGPVAFPPRGVPAPAPPPEGSGPALRAAAAAAACFRRVCFRKLRTAAKRFFPSSFSHFARRRATFFARAAIIRAATSPSPSPEPVDDALALASAYALLLSADVVTLDVDAFLDPPRVVVVGVVGVLFPYSLHASSPVDSENVGDPPELDR